MTNDENIAIAFAYCLISSLASAFTSFDKMTTSTPPSSKRVRDNGNEDPDNADLMPCSETKRLKQHDSESDPGPLPWGCHTHIGGRPYQEDAFLHSSLEGEPQLPGSPGATPTEMYGVFDGHGGDSVSSYLKSNASAFIAEALRTSGNSSVEVALKAAFVKMDAGLPANGKDKGGSTATICLLNEERIICANCGE